MGSDIVQFGSYDLEEAKKERAEFDTGGFLKIKTGRNVLRILPPPVGVKSPFVRVWQHFFTAPGAEQASSFTCPRMMAKKHCPACAKADELKASRNPADIELANDLFARKRVYANVLNRAAPDAGVQIYAFGKTVDDALVGIREDDPDDDYTHPINGFDVIIERSGTGKMGTKYTVRGARNRSKLCESAEEMNHLISTQPDLTKFARVPTTDEVLEKLGALGEESHAPRGTGLARRHTIDAEVIESKPLKTAKRRTMQDDALDEDDDIPAG